MLCNHPATQNERRSCARISRWQRHSSECWNSYRQRAKRLTNMEGQPDDLAHDAYFHVQRVEHDEAGVFVRAILAARLVFLKEVADNGVTIGIDKLEWIDRGFADLLNCFFGGVVNSATGVTEWQSAGETCAAMQRWVHGHQIFAALTQGLILSFRSIGQALRAGHAEEVRQVGRPLDQSFERVRGRFRFYWRLSAG